MDAATLHKQIAALRDDDGLIAQALSDLDTTLATWLTVMLEGQTAMLAQFRRNDTPADAPTIERSDTVDSPPKQPDSPGSRLFRGSASSTVNLDHKPPISETPNVTPDNATMTPDDDEELMASLDIETASVIRVKRRLSNNTKSVRELLDELGIEQSSSKGANPRRSRWWRKDNE